MNNFKVGMIESNTDYDILNWDDYTMDVINRHDSDDEVKTVEVYGKNCMEIINVLNSL
jgi:hypothetical protein